MFITLRLSLILCIYFLFFSIFCERARVRVINWRAPNVHVSLQFTRSRIDMQIWFRRGCAAEAAKPVPIFKGHFGGKGTHY